MIKSMNMLLEIKQNVGKHERKKTNYSVKACMGGGKHKC